MLDIEAKRRIDTARPILVSKLLFLFLYSFISVAIAQDSHHWTQQYGSRSALMGGIVVGGVRDNSAVFYNPGALALIAHDNLSINANGYQYDLLRIKDGAGTGLDLNSKMVQIIPLMVTGLYKIKKNTKHSFGYGILSRHQSEIRMSARNDSLLNAIADYNAPGKEEYIGQYNLKTYLYELWTGVTYSYRLNDHVAFGVSDFVAYRNQSLDASFVARVIPTDSTYLSIAPLISANDFISCEYTNYRNIIKLGTAFDFSRLKIGVSFTLPSINIGGRAVVNRDISAGLLNYNGDSMSTYINAGYTPEQFAQFVLYPFTMNDRQPEGNDVLSTIYKSPLSVAAGVEYKLGSTLLATTAEWFDKINHYNIAVPKSKEFLRPKSAKYGLTSDQFLRIREGAKSVFNYGFGIEQPLTKSIIALVSYRVNKSYYIADDSLGLVMNVTNWDLYHVNIGTTFKSEKSDLNIGITYAYGHNTPYQFINLTEPLETNFLNGETKQVALYYHSLGIILGYTYYF